jgi:PIN domain nuclease of toxin-antitoxin system
VKLLLDTHALLWGLAGDDRLGANTRDLIVDPGNQVLISIVSLWEIAVKIRVGKLEADVAEIAKAAADEGIELLGISLAHLETLKRLPFHHRDPFDHLLIAQAMTEGADFVSDDRNVGLYEVRCIPCASPPS